MPHGGGHLVVESKGNTRASIIERHKSPSTDYVFNENLVMESNSEAIVVR